MARASRSSKKLPAFDPSELSDLIFSPAVGRGVGSHLLETVDATPAQPSPSLPASDLLSDQKDFNMFTVGTNVVSSVDRSNYPPVVNLDLSAADDLPVLPSASVEERSQAVVITSDSRIAEPPTVNLPTVDRLTGLGSFLEEIQDTWKSFDLSTVDNTNSAEESSLSLLLSTVDNPQLSHRSRDLLSQEEVPSTSDTQKFSNDLHKHPKAVADGDPSTNLSTVGGLNSTTVEVSAAPAFVGRRTLRIWITEQGELVPPGRVKRIGPAQDVLNSAEESVYDTLWAARIVESGDEQSRIVQAGYHFLAKKTRLSKKTIQRIVDKLIHKGFIEIKEQADIYARTSTIYRVFCYSAVKERQRRRNRLYVAKIGPGFTYVYEHAPEHVTTVDRSHVTIRDRTVTSTEDEPSIVTVVPRSLSTVVRTTTTEVGRYVLDKTPLSGIHQALNEYGTADDAVQHLLQRCRQITPDCTEEEIIHFIHQKGNLIRGKGSEIYSPIGFLVTAVPKCFSGESFRLYRDEQRRRREAEEAAERERQRELDEWRREQESRLADPSVPEEDKRLIRECLGL